MINRAVKYLRDKEWSGDKGMCPQCCGLQPGRWYGTPLGGRPASLPGSEGHKAVCALADALEDLGEAVQRRDEERWGWI